MRPDHGVARPLGDRPPEDHPGHDGRAYL